MERTIASLISDIEERKLALPQFQREYRWSVENVEELLRSIGQDFPVGTLLLLNQEDAKYRLEPVVIKDAPALRGKPQYLLLDGQQRLTSLYHAYHSIGTQRYFVNLRLLEKKKTLVDEAIFSVPAKKESQEVGTPDDRRQELILTFEEAYSLESFTAFLASPLFTDEQRQRLAQLHQQHLAIFREHTVTCELIPGTLPVAAIAKVFERTNRRVLALNAFDLMVAVMWPFKFKLRSEWEAAREKYPILTEYRVTGLDILRLLALREYLNGREKKASTTKVSGIRQSDILEIPPATVKRDWAAAVRAYVHSLEFARDEFGVISRALMPNVTMWVPLADALWRGVPGKKTAKHQKLARWFWAAAFSRQYARGANTRATSDGELLRGWFTARRGGRPPEYVRRFRVDETDFSEAADEGNEIVVRATSCLLNTKGARDWSKTHGEPPPRLGELDAALQIHHVFPTKFLSQQRVRSGLADAPANQVLISASLNSQLNNQPPEYAATSTLVNRDALASHAVDPQLLKGNFPRFLKARGKALATLVNQTIQ